MSGWGERRVPSGDLPVGTVDAPERSHRRRSVDGQEERQGSGRIEDLLNQWREADRALVRASARREAGEAAARAAKESRESTARAAEAAAATEVAAREAARSAVVAQEAARETAETSRHVLESAEGDLETLAAAEESAKVAELEAAARYRTAEEAARGIPKRMTAS
jgi:hypothetical protein